MFNDYALIASEETVSALSEGLIQGKIAVCVVRDAVAEVHVAWPADVRRLTRGLPVVPSARGRETVNLPFDEELEAIQAIEDAVRDEITRLSLGPPASFMEVRPVLTSGLTMMFQEHGLDVRISDRLAECLRWREGDRISFGISPDGAIGTLYCEEAGTALTPSQANIGHLEVSSYLGLPTRFVDLATDWEAVQYWISGGRIYFDMMQFGSASDEAEEDESFDAAPFGTSGSVFDSSVFQGVVAGALAAASISMIARLVM